MEESIYGQIFRWIAVVAGSGVVLYNLWWLLRSCLLRVTGKGALGEVVYTRRVRVNRRGRVYYPLIAFMDDSGVSHEVESENPASPVRCGVGRRVKIVYSARNPERIRVDEFGSRGTVLQFYMIFFGIFFSWIALDSPGMHYVYLAYDWMSG